MPRSDAVKARHHDTNARIKRRRVAGRDSIPTMPTDEREHDEKRDGTEKRREPRELVEKARKLVKLTHNENEEEASSAALQAVRLLERTGLFEKTGDLMIVSRAEVERVNKQVSGALAEAKKAKDDKTSNVLMGAFAGFLAAKNKLLG